MIPDTLYALWWIGLAVAYVALLPTAVYWLHSLWRTAASIRRYARESADAAEQIARNLAPLPALDTTIAVASEILDAAQGVAGKLDTAAGALESRARN